MVGAVHVPPTRRQTTGRERGLFGWPVASAPETSSDPSGAYAAPFTLPPMLFGAGGSVVGAQDPSGWRVQAVGKPAPFWPSAVLPCGSSAHTWPPDPSWM